MHHCGIYGRTCVSGLYVRPAIPLCKNGLLLGSNASGPLFWLIAPLSRPRCNFGTCRFCRNLHRRAILQLDVRGVGFQFMGSNRATYSDEHGMVYFYDGRHGSCRRRPDIKHSTRGKHILGHRNNDVA